MGFVSHLSNSSAFIFLLTGSTIEVDVMFFSVSVVVPTVAVVAAVVAPVAMFKRALFESAS